ncbi:hypothetical protein PV325_011998 [Microctonus aethiopoides]|nr:hypothetical protein PV325_011998 [Microctonus aethiopoides]
MKIDYIGMLLLVCVIQTLIGSSHGLSNDQRNCSTIVCGDHEECKEFDDHHFSCVCSPDAARINNTGGCLLKYEWVSYTRDLIHNERLAAIKLGSKPWFVFARAIYLNGDKIPGNGGIHEDGSLSFHGKKMGSYHYRVEVLLMRTHHWWWSDYSSNGEIVKDAIIGGNIGNETVYICGVPDIPVKEYAQVVIMHYVC